MLIAIVPAESEVLATFTAPDPWNANVPASFRVRLDHAGGFVPGHAVFDKRSRWQRYYLCTGTGREGRRLPDSLTSLWLEGQLPIEQLPRALALLEPQLSATDFVTHDALNPMQRAVRRWAPRVLAVFVVGLGVSMWGSDRSTALVMIAIGLAIAAAAWWAGQRLGARRRQQQSTALAAVVSAAPAGSMQR